MDQANDSRLSQVRHEPLLHKIVAVGCGSADPPAGSPESMCLVADPVREHLALELREGEQDVEYEPPETVLRVERLGYAYERHIELVEEVDQSDKVRQGASQAIQLVDHDHVNQALLHRTQQFGEIWPVQITTGEAAIVIVLGNLGPIAVALRSNIG
nr:hypothetical protein [Sphingomonas sp. AP4-R1]